MSNVDDAITQMRAGNRADYVLGTREGWRAFRVIRWHGVEGLSIPHRFAIDVLRPHDDGPVDLAALVNTGATLRIATNPRWRMVHGIISEAEEIDRTGTIFVYRFVLVPHILRANYRTRCRNFVDKSLQEILTVILENRSPAHPEGLAGLKLLRDNPTAHERQPNFTDFEEPDGWYRFAMSDSSRISDPTVYPYVVQYNETDFDFLSRLLAEEGLTYHLEHAKEGLVMTITHRPGTAPLFPEDENVELQGAHNTTQQNQEVLRTLREPHRLQTASVTMRDHDYNRHHIQLESSVADGTGDPDVLGRFTYPGWDENVAANPTEYPARVALERLQTERAMVHGSGTLRRLEPGRRFVVKDPAGGRPDANYISVRSETYATELAIEGTALDDEPFGFSRTRA